MSYLVHSAIQVDAPVAAPGHFAAPEQQVCDALFENVSKTVWTPLFVIQLWGQVQTSPSLIRQWLEAFLQRSLVAAAAAAASSFVYDTCMRTACCLM